MNSDKSPRRVIEPIKRDNSPSPNSYNNLKAKEFTMPRRVSGVLPKVKLTSFIDTYVNEKKKIPGVNEYDTSEQWKNTSRKLSLPRFKRGL